MALDLVAELDALLQALAADGIPYALCGGLAVGIHGHVRATEDIDMLILEEDVGRAKETARRLGFDVPSGALPFSAGTPKERIVHRVSKVAGEQWLSLDLMLVGPVLQCVWDERIEVQWRRRPITVVSLDGLAVMKRLAGRYKDMGDLVALGLEEEADDA